MYHSRKKEPLRHHPPPSNGPLPRSLASEGIPGNNIYPGATTPATASKPPVHLEDTPGSQSTRPDPAGQTPPQHAQQRYKSTNPPHKYDHVQPLTPHYLHLFQPILSPRHTVSRDHTYLPQDLTMWKDTLGAQAAPHNSAMTT